jgi:hypothetical protein
MGQESHIGNVVGKISPSLRSSITRNLSIAVPFAVCGTAQLVPAEHPAPLDKNIDGTYCLQCPAVNPEVKPQVQSIHWLSESQSGIALERN